jgi:hypothetical protein
VEIVGKLILFADKQRPELVQVSGFVFFNAYFVPEQTKLLMGGLMISHETGPAGLP